MKLIIYHIIFTIFATDKQNESKLLNIASDIKMNKIKLKINDIRIMNGRNNSFVLYFSIEENKDIKELQKNFFYKFLERIMIQINLLFI